MRKNRVKIDLLAILEFIENHDFVLIESIFLFENLFITPQKKLTNAIRQN
jgi:hypothetical protein